MMSGKNKILKVESTEDDELIATIIDDKEIVVMMKVVDEFYSPLKEIIKGWNHESGCLFWGGNEKRSVVFAILSTSGKGKLDLYL